MSWCHGFKKSYDVKSATAMSSVVVSRTAMTKECDCYVIQNSDKATKRCHSFHPVHTDHNHHGRMTAAVDAFTIIILHGKAHS